MTSSAIIQTFCLYQDDHSSVRQSSASDGAHTVYNVVTTESTSISINYVSILAFCQVLLNEHDDDDDDVVTV